MTRNQGPEEMEEHANDTLKNDPDLDLNEDTAEDDVEDEMVRRISLTQEIVVKWY